MNKAYDQQTHDEQREKLPKYNHVHDRPGAKETTCLHTRIKPLRHRMGKGTLEQQRQEEQARGSPEKEGTGKKTVWETGGK